MRSLVKPLCFQVPDSDMEVFGALRQSVRERVLLLLSLFESIHAAPKVKRACKDLAEQCGHQRGLTAHVLRTKYFLFKRGTAEFPPGDWRLLVDRAKAGALWQRQERVRVPDGTWEFFQSLCVTKGRGKAREAWMELCDQWRRWRAGDASAAIPGYVSCPAPDPRTDLPRGWTFSGFRKRLSVDVSGIPGGRSCEITIRPIHSGTRSQNQNDPL